MNMADNNSIITNDENDHAKDKDAFISINNIPVFFSEDWNTGIGGGLWTTGTAMAKYFDRHADDVIKSLNRLHQVKTCIREDTSEGISVMELGSGNGFLSVCLLALLANSSTNVVPIKELVVTDLADHLDLMALTLKANPHVWDELSVIEKSDGSSNGGEVEIKSVKKCSGANDQYLSKKAPPVIVAEHMWGEFPASNNSSSNNSSSDYGVENKKYDFIFGTDLAYRNSLHKPLIASLLHFSHQHTISLIGVTMTDTQPVFFDLLTQAGFRYERLADHLIEKEFRGVNFSIIAIQKR